MRPQIWQCSLVAFSMLMLPACSHPSGTAPSGSPVAVAIGTQALRVTFQSPCPRSGDGSLLGIVYTQVDVSRSGSEWIARAAGDGGDVELRFHQSGAAVIPGSMPVAGTIKGTAIHMPALLPGAPIDARMAFGATATVSGVAFAPPFSPSTGLDGLGTGPVVLSDSAGRSCSGTAFSWGIGPQG